MLLSNASITVDGTFIEAPLQNQHIQCLIRAGHPCARCARIHRLQQSLQLELLTTADALWPAITDHFPSSGHAMIYCQEAFDLLGRIGWEEADAVLGPSCRR
jgi:hypothetical protein